MVNVARSEPATSHLLVRNSRIRALHQHKAIRSKHDLMLKCFPDIPIWKRKKTFESIRRAQTLRRGFSRCISWLYIGIVIINRVHKNYSWIIKPPTDCRNLMCIGLYVTKHSAITIFLYLQYMYFTFALMIQQKIFSDV